MSSPRPTRAGLGDPESPAPRHGTASRAAVRRAAQPSPKNRRRPAGRSARAPADGAPASAAWLRSGDSARCAGARRRARTAPPSAACRPRRPLPRRRRGRPVCADGGNGAGTRESPTPRPRHRGRGRRASLGRPGPGRGREAGRLARSPDPASRGSIQAGLLRECNRLPRRVAKSLHVVAVRFALCQTRATFWMSREVSRNTPASAGKAIP